MKMGFHSWINRLSNTFFRENGTKISFQKIRKLRLRFLLFSLSQKIIFFLFSVTCVDMFFLIEIFIGESFHCKQNQWINIRMYVIVYNEMKQVYFSDLFIKLYQISGLRNECNVKSLYDSINLNELLKLNSYMT